MEFHAVFPASILLFDLNLAGGKAVFGNLRSCRSPLKSNRVIDLLDDSFEFFVCKFISIVENSL